MSKILREVLGEANTEPQLLREVLKDKHKKEREKDLREKRDELKKRKERLNG